MDLSIVIPFKDEALRLPESLRKIEKFFSQESLSYKLILVDDGSTDNTIEEIGYFLNLPHVRLIRHVQNKGKGAALQTGVMKAQGKYVLCTDADLSTPIKEVTKLLRSIEQYDIVIGSRAVKGAILEVKQPFHRQLIGKAGNLLIRMVLGLNLQDTQCGFKLYKRDVAQKLFQDLRFLGFSADYEVLYKAKNLGYSIREVGVIWKDSQPSRVDPVKDTYRALRDLVKLRLR